MGILTKYAYNYIHAMLETSLLSDIIALGSSVIIGAIIYAIEIIILRIDEVNIIKDMIKKKVKK